MYVAYILDQHNTHNNEIKFAVDYIKAKNGWVFGWTMGGVRHFNLLALCRLLAE